MAVNTLRSGFVPFEGRQHLPGRRTSGAQCREALAERVVGRTVLHVYHGERGTGAMGRTMRKDSYSVVALGNTSRETKTLGSGMTYDQAVEFLNAYNPRWGLMK